MIDVFCVKGSLSMHYPFLSLLLSAVLTLCPQIQTLPLVMFVALSISDYFPEFPPILDDF